MPFIPGIDVAGDVAEVGSSVSDFKPGDAVYAWADFMRNGSYAEYVTVKATSVAPKPTSLDYIHAAAVPQTALTAWQALFETGGLQPGQTVLVHAGHVQPVVQTVLPLHEARQAHELSQTGHVRGKIVLQV